jgi:hypothetical protein
MFQQNGASSHTVKSTAAWDEIMERDIDAYDKHMEDWVKAVLKVNGGHTLF